MMLKTQFIRSVVTILAFMAAQQANAQAGNSGLSFLKLGVSGRGVSMADAMAAHVTGAASVYYNPAGLAAPSGQDAAAQIVAMHKEWILDTRMEFLGTSVQPDEKNGIGFFFNSTTVSEIELRERPGTAQGTFTARNYSAGASFARSISDDFRIGITGKFLYEKILIDEASGAALDLGMQYTTPLEGYIVGIVIANLGTMSKLRNEMTRLPVLMRVGSSYSHGFEEIVSATTFAADFVYIFPERASLVNLGGELIVHERVAARAGYQMGSEGRGFTTGIGLYHGSFGLDYAFTPLSPDLGAAHTISLFLNL